MMRNPVHGFALPAWPAGPTTALDGPRRALDDLLAEFRSDVATVYDDRRLSAEGRIGELQKMASRIRPLVEDMQRRVAGARVVYDKTAAKLDGAPDRGDIVGELRRREIRDHLAGLTSEQRYLALDAAIRERDTETLQAVVQTPALRTSIVTPQQREQARRELWQATDADAAARQEQLAAQLPAFDETLRVLDEQMGRLASGDAAYFADFEQKRRSAEGFQAWWRDYNGEPADASAGAA